MRQLTKTDGTALLKAARSAIKSHVIKRQASTTANLAAFDQPAGVFVSIHKSGFLRGCIGLPYPTLPLSQGILEASVKACSDPRFTPLTADEIGDIKLEVSVLSPPEEIGIIEPNEILASVEPHQDGLIMRRGSRGALFLPQVWKSFPRPEDFLSQLCMKAGLASDAWKERGCQFWRFNAQVFSE